MLKTDIFAVNENGKPITFKMVEATGICHNFDQMELGGRGLAREIWQQNVPGNIRNGIFCQHEKFSRHC